MELRKGDAIACEGGSSARVKRGKNKILEMELHLKSLKEKLNTLETMLPHSKTDDDQQDCPKTNEGNLNKDEMCVLQSLAVKEKKLRDEIFKIECKEKEYLQTLSQANVENNINEDKCNFTRIDNSLRSRKGESVEIEKISRLEEYSKKLCNCLRSIKNNRKIWSRQAGDLSKELNCLENSGLKSSQDFGPEGYKTIENKICPCGEPAKCDSCIICNCADWEQNLKIDIDEKREEFNELQQKEVSLVDKKSNCRCFYTSSNSDASSQSLEINNIYQCSLSKMHSEMSIETLSVPSTVDCEIIGNEEDRKNYCCLCKSEDDYQKFCEICLCDWEREYNTNQQLYSVKDDENCHRCNVCNEERFRGGTDFGISINHHCYENCTENLTNILKPTAHHDENKEIREKIPNDLEDKRFLTHSSLVSKCLKIEKTKRKEVIATLMKELNQTPISIRTEIYEQPKKKEQSNFTILTKDLAFGFLILLLTYLLLG
ncbi:uncharacterized protein LOC122497874 [Leptopilina heterotoma]|uniref:uncharacterized protein LOC122497874 n=1 Tax=Leptopilina heterotoma TaxID=63436 RepID=UPI001CA8B804|nr:uncharacterized protein LOC122497874 [Leptopilina heterotoma]